MRDHPIVSCAVLSVVPCVITMRTYHQLHSGTCWYVANTGVVSLYHVLLLAVCRQQLSSCTHSAVGYICGDDFLGPCHMYMSNITGYALAHELGHHLGLHHAGLDGSNTGNVSSTDPNQYGGDRTDVMGKGALQFDWTPNVPTSIGFAGSTPMSFNARHREMLGVLPSSHVVDVSLLGVPCRQQITLLALHVDPDTTPGTQVVRFARSFARGGGMYYASFRKAVEYDAGLEHYLYDNKVHVHYAQSHTVSH